MDSFSLIIFLILIMVAISQGLTWVAGVLIVLFVIAVRSKGLLITAIIGMLMAYMFQAQEDIIMLIAAVIVLGLFMFVKGGGSGPEMYSPGMLLGGK